MNRFHSQVSFVGAAGIILVLLPNAARADFSKTITVNPGEQTQAVATWYFANCTTILGVGSYSITVAPQHGALTFGTVSGPITGCPAGSPSLPAAAANYIWFDTTPGSSRDYFQLTFSVDGQSEIIDVTVNLSHSVAPPPAPTPPANCPIDVRPLPVTNPAVSPFPTMMTARFVNSQPLIPDVAAQCGFDSFDWQQTLTYLPTPNRFIPNDSSLINPLNLVYDYSILNYTIKAPPDINDPGPGGWKYLGGYNPYPFTRYVYPDSANGWYAPGCRCTYGGGIVGCTNHIPTSVCVTNPAVPYQVSADGTTLGFSDAPTDPKLIGAPPSILPGDGTYIAFRTSLVGVSAAFRPGSSLCDPTQLASSLYCTTLYVWTWNTTFNGTGGGISQTASLYPPDPGSGTGGITITSINGVQLPSSLSSSQTSITASGLAYSRVTQTFNGTITMKNVGTSPINGPLQILLMGLPVGVTLLNGAGDLSGTPFLTIPAETGLAPGQSLTVNVQFKNSSNTAIAFTPVAYSGGIN